MIAYVEMIGGASGNMLLGALVDAGAELSAIEEALRTIPVSGWSLEHRRVQKCGIAATFVDFVIPGEDHHAHPDPEEQRRHVRAHGRHLAEVLAIVAASGLTVSQQARARRVYERLAEAEARVHGTTADAVQFHEVGAVDAILDVAAVCVAFDLLGVERIVTSPFPLGRGSISMHHGIYPNPPPATADLLRGWPTFDAGIEGEMVTTTGAALLTSLAEPDAPRPSLVVDRIGYGAGRSDFPIPNVLRAMIGRAAEPSLAGSDEVAVLEANVDDMSPQLFELALERVLAAGAFDAWLAPVTMKKSRPAILFGAVAPLDREAAVARAMLVETTTLGVRARRERRYILERRIERVETPFGPVRVKTATLDGQARRTLEYDDVARIARERERPVAEVVRELEELLFRS